MNRRLSATAFLTAVLVSIALVASGAPAPTAKTDDVKFTDAQKQTAEFMGYWKNLPLTPQQEAIKREALSALPAPCCDDNSLYTCCCPCNMAKTSWGLANYLIAKKGYGVHQVRTKVADWVRFINPQGYPGDTCYTGGCNKPFAKAGCGGMAEPVVF